MEINKYIDHTNLKAYASKEDIETLCKEVKKYNFASVCVNPYYVSYAYELLKNTDVKVCTVIGFPLGQNTNFIKASEARDAINNGADEIDMVINIAALKNQDYDYVKEEIKCIKEVVNDKILKVIIETCYLTKEEIIKMTKICNEVEVDFIKTSTGFGPNGAKIEDIDVINAYKSNNLQIKASGGIKNYQDALSFINKGVTRIGTSNGVKIMEGDKE